MSSLPSQFLSRQGALLGGILFVFIGFSLAAAGEKYTGAQNKRLYWRHDVGNGTLAVPAPPGPTSLTPPDPSACVPYDCNLFYQWVSVYYWPEPDANTDCLSTLLFPAQTMPPDLEMVWPSIYAVFPSISAFNGCSQIGNTFKDITKSFAPGELSTIDSNGGATKVFNFADLPCPPPDKNVAAGQEYKPLIAPPPFIFTQDPAFSTCIPGAYQGIDPPIPIEQANHINKGHRRHGQQKRHLHQHIRAPMTAWTPERTAPPVAPFRVVAGLGKG